jgi:hypothetical protein
MLKFQIFCGMTLVYIAADISCFFITRVVFRNILLIVQLTYPIDFVNKYVLEFSRENKFVHSMLILVTLTHNLVK